MFGYLNITRRTSIYDIGISIFVNLMIGIRWLIASIAIGILVRMPALFLTFVFIKIRGMIVRMEWNGTVDSPNRLSPGLVALEGQRIRNA
jgi:hypothetical protein